MRRTAHLRLQILAAMAVVLVAATQLTLGDGSARVRGRLGPTPGPSSEGYVQSKRAYLERIARSDPARPAGALVSFSRFVSAGQAEALISGMEATAGFIRLPQGGTEVVDLRTGSLRTAVAQSAELLAEQLRAEIVSIEAQLRGARGAGRAQLEESLEERRRALGDLGPECRCVYAVAVQRTTLGALRHLQYRPEVRVVDVPNPTTDDLAGFQLTPILPSS